MTKRFCDICGKEYSDFRIPAFANEIGTRQLPEFYAIIDRYNTDICQDCFIVSKKIDAKAILIEHWKILADPAGKPPEADVTGRQGTWIHHHKWDKYTCSECSCEEKHPRKYCPECGAHMKELCNA